MFIEFRLRYIHTIGIILIVVGCLNLIGWQFNITFLRSLSSEMTSMNPLTAITFIIAGWWIFSFEENKKPWKAYLIGSIVLLVGFMHTLSYQLSLDYLRFDHLLFKEKLATSLINSHLAPITALLFVICGFIILSSYANKKWVLYLRQLLSMVVFIIAYSAVLGYLYGRESAYRVAGVSTIALSTAILFLLLSTALFLCNIMIGMPKLYASIFEGSTLLRRVSFFMLVFPPILGYFRIWGEKKGYYSTEHGVEIHTIILTIAIFILVYFYAQLLNNKQKISAALETQLAASELKFRKLVSSLSEGVASLDFSGNVIYCNPSYCKILGYTEEELVGSNIVEMIIPIDNKPTILEKIHQRQKGIVENYQTEIIRKDGEKIIINVKTNIILDNVGQSNSYVVSINDITDEIRKLEDVQAFSSSAAHDLNSPINKILTIVDLVDPNSLNEENKDFIQMIKTIIVNMKVLTQDLLAFSRLGSQTMEKTLLNLNEIVNEVCTIQKPKDFKGTLTLSELPMATGNETAVKQVFNNLISNAFKYSSKMAEPSIEIGAYNKEGRQIYFVKDNGVGLNAEQMKTLFTPFKRYHSKFEGNGLGLAIVKRVIDKHGGSIFAESDTDKGLTIHFTLSP
jgi:PAS domain S-box-containing protein